MKAYRVWGIAREGQGIAKDGHYEIIASTAYELEARAQAICDRNNRVNGDIWTFEVRVEEVPGEITVNGHTMKTDIVVMGGDSSHKRFT